MVVLRELTRHDREALMAFHQRCSDDTHYLRFFGAKPHLSDTEAAHFCDVDQARRGALVAIDPRAPEAIVGVGRWDALDGSEEAEIALVVEDCYQGHGVGRMLLTAVLHRMDALGFRYAVGDMLPANHRMRALVNQAGVCTWTCALGVSSFRLAVESHTECAA